MTRNGAITVAAAKECFACVAFVALSCVACSAVMCRVFMRLIRWFKPHPRPVRTFQRQRLVMKRAAAAMKRPAAAKKAVGPRAAAANKRWPSGALKARSPLARWVADRLWRPAAELCEVAGCKRSRKWKCEPCCKEVCGRHLWRHAKSI